jgi:VWFA-related protein
LALAVSPLQSAYLSPPESRLVNLTVIAVDIHGDPVTDLTSDDFQVFDSGKEQKIAFFHHSDSARWQASGTSQNEFSNRGGAEIRYATVILFDLMNESFGTRGYAADQIVHSLQDLETADYLYFYFLTLDGRLVALHGLPDTGKVMTSASEEPWTRQIKPLLNDALRKLTAQRPVDIDVAARVALTFQALENLAEQLSRVPGRKNIVWVTDGVPIGLGPVRSDTGDIVDFTPQIRRLGEGLDRSGVAIYPARELMLGTADGIGETSDAGQTGGEGTGIQSIETLNEFAGVTGGRPDSGKDVAAVIKQALSDVRTSYQIGYYPLHPHWDNKFHKLRVTCKRKGVRIQARTGYYAWEEPPGTRAQQAFHSAASNTFDAAEIGLRASVSFDPQGGRLAHLDLRIDAHDIALVHEGNDYLGQLRLTVVHYLTGGGVESEPIIPVDLHYDAQQCEEALKEGIDYAQNVPIGKSGYQFRIIVFDRGSNAIGSLTLPDHDNSRLTLPQLNSR